MAKYNELGQEIPDPNPIAVPLKFTRPETMDEKIRRLIRSSELARRAQAEGFETEEEANDFEVDDDPEVIIPSEYELAGLTPREMAMEFGIDLEGPADSPPRTCSSWSVQPPQLRSLVARPTSARSPPSVWRSWGGLTALMHPAGDALGLLARVFPLPACRQIACFF